ncbi:ABC transporter substrate-binding protein [Jiangella endophytica]|uniref:ABC transporter substrate-binding protein n=1 Tax=Jiangella endophytica TaxID=1623398 RepID=UPI000E34B134|nr:ABC transporter substrate-binding protein [Jiangella endophytica]
MGKRVAAAAGVGVLLAGITACGGSGGDEVSGAAGSGEPIRIGVDLDLSGPFSIGGQGALKGIEAYFDAVNEAGGIAGREVELTTLDSAADVNRALSNVQQLINQDQVDALLGVSVSSISEALDPVVADHEIPLVSVAAAPSQIFPDPSDWVVMAQSVQNQQVGPAVQLIGELVDSDQPRVAYIHFDSAAHHGFGNGLTEAVESRGWELTAAEVVPLTAAPDVRAQASNIVASRPDVVVSLMTDKNSKLLQETLRVQGFTGPIIQNPDTGPDVLDQVTDDPNFYLMTHTYIDNTESDDIGGDDNWAAMTDAFDATGVPVDTAYSVRGYINAQVLGNALEECGGCTGAELRDTLVGTTVPTDGITPGDISFAEDNHQGVEAVPIYRWNGQLEHVGDYPTGTGLD